MLVYFRVLNPWAHTLKPCFYMNLYMVCSYVAMYVLIVTPCMYACIYETKCNWIRLREHFRTRQIKMMYLHQYFNYKWFTFWCNITSPSYFNKYRITCLRISVAARKNLFHPQHRKYKVIMLDENSTLKLV